MRAMILSALVFSFSTLTLASDPISPQDVAAVLQQYSQQYFNSSDSSGFQILDVRADADSVTFTIFKNKGARVTGNCWDHNSSDETDPNMYSWTSGSFSVTVPGPFQTFVGDGMTFIQSPIGQIRQSQPWIDINYISGIFGLSLAGTDGNMLECMTDGK